MEADWRARLESVLKTRGMTMKGASLAAGLGETFVRDALRRERKPSIDKFAALARVLEIPPMWLLTGEGDSGLERTKGQPILFVPGEEVVIPGRELLLPVYSGAQGGNGKLIIGTDIVDRVEMPAALKDVQGAYGLMVDGTSMIPEYWEGDVAWINPILRPARGKNHIFYHTPPLGEEAEAIIKRLNGWNDREWDLQQWNPPKEYKESRKIWPIAHRVVGKYDAA